MARVTILSYDRVLDRRALLQASTLRAHGHEVLLYAQSHAHTTHDPDYVRRLGSLPESPTPAIHPPRALSFRNRFEQKFPALFRRALPLLRPLYWALNGCNPVRLYMALYREAMASMPKADLYIAHDLPMLPVAAAMKRRDAAKLLYDSHELFCEQEFRSFERRMWQRLEQETIPQADATITVNPSIAEWLQSQYQLSHVGVIYNAEALSPTLLHPSSAALKQQLGLALHTRIVLYQGGLSHGRNLELLPRLLPHLAADIHLVVLGSGPLRATLYAIAEQLGVSARFHMLEAVPQHALLALTQSADLGIIPYRDTCLNYRYCTPNKLFEFIAAGVPMVATDLPEISRLLATHGIGRVGNSAQPAEFAALIETVLEPATLAALKAATLKARTRVNWDVEGEKFLRIVEELLA